MINSEQSEVLDSSPTPLTRDFIGLCIGILSVVLVILIVAICKWSRCLCLRRQQDTDDPNEVFSSILQHNTSTPHRQSRRPHNHSHHRQQQQQPYQQQSQQPRSSSCDHRPGNFFRHISETRNEHTSASQPGYNGQRLNDLKVPRVTITTLPVQPSQQLVPRLSLSPQVSGSSITRSSYSIKQ